MDVPETRYAKSGNVHIAYCIRGHGPVDLVYIPGWISNIKLMWEDRWMRPWLDRLATFSRLIAFDKRGTGLSDRVPDDRLPDLETRMDDVRAVMDAAGSQRAFLLGHSEGGLLAALFATTYPARTAGVVFFSSDIRVLGPQITPGGRHERSLSASSKRSSAAGATEHFESVRGGTRALPGQGRRLPRLARQVLPAECKPERHDRHQPHVV